jgi:Flp pilus assembly protein TadD
LALVSVPIVADAAELPRYHALGTAPGSSPAAREALTLCVHDDGTEDRLDRSVALAEQAIASKETDPVAHFALFCAVGRQAEAAGVGGVFGARRALRAVERTLQLAPEWSDALAGKGAMLMQLPRLMGGDVAEGERLLRRAVTIDPKFPEAYYELARGLKSARRRDEARDAARQAVEVAEAIGDARTARRARELLDQLGK